MSAPPRRGLAKRLPKKDRAAEEGITDAEIAEMLKRAERNRKEKKEFHDRIHGTGKNTVFSKREVDAEIIDMSFTRNGWF